MLDEDDPLRPAFGCVMGILLSGAILALLFGIFLLGLGLLT